MKYVKPDLEEIELELEGSFLAGDSAIDKSNTEQDYDEYEWD